MDGMTLGSAYVEIGAKTKGLDDIEIAMSRASRQVDAHTNKINSTLKSMTSTINGVAREVARGAALIGSGLVAAAGVGLKLAADMETTKTAFTQMLGSGEKAGRMLEDLSKFAEKTPFGFSDVTTASKKLLGLGFEAGKIIPTLTAVGDAVAGIGGGKDAIDGIIRQLGQMRLKTKVSAEELVTLTEWGIPAYQILQEKLGLSAKQMENIGKAGIPAKAAVDALVDGMGEKFAGMMDAQSASMTGLWSTAVDQVKNFGTAVIGVGRDGTIATGSLFEFAKGELEEFSGKMETWAEDGTLDRWAREAREVVGTAMDKFEDLLDTLGDIKDWAVNHGPELKLAAAGFVTAWAFTNTITGISNIVTAIGNLKTAMAGLGLASQIQNFGLLGLLITGAANIPNIARGMVDYTNGQINDAKAKVREQQETTAKARGESKLGKELSKSTLDYASITKTVTSKVSASLADAKKLLTTAGIIGKEKPKPKPTDSPVNGYGGPKASSGPTQAERYAEIMAEFNQARNVRDRQEAQLGKYYDYGAAKLSDYQSAVDALNRLSIPEAVKKAKELNSAIVKMMQGQDAQKWAVKQKKAAEEVAETQKRLAKEVAEKQQKAMLEAMISAMAPGLAAEKARRGTTGGMSLAQFGAAAQEAEDDAMRRQWLEAAEAAQPGMDAERARRGTTGGKSAQQFAVEAEEAARAASFFGKATRWAAEPLLQFNGLLNQLNPVTALVTAIMTTLAPVIENLLVPITLVGVALATAIAPILKALFPVLKFFGQVVIGVAKVIANVWNGLIDMVAWIPGLGGLRQFKINVTALSDAQAALTSLTWDNARATMEQYQATHQLVPAITQATESLKNVPQLFKATLTRSQVSMPQYADGGYVPHTGPAILHRGEYVLTRDEVSKSLHTGRGQTSGSIEVHVHTEGSTNIGVRELVKTVKRGVFEGARAAGLSQFGSPFATSGVSR